MKYDHKLASLTAVKRTADTYITEHDLYWENMVDNLFI